MAILKVAEIHFNADGSKTLANTSNGVTFNTNIHAVDFNSTSDATLKENIIVIDDALNRIERINGVTFNWKNNHQASAGVLAQELKEILPEVVNTYNEHMTVNYSGVIALLVEAIKELNKKIESLKN